MNWRRFHWILCAAMVLVAAVRLATGHLLGAVAPIVLAVVFASIAADYPLWRRLRQGFSLLNRRRR